MKIIIQLLMILWLASANVLAQPFKSLFGADSTIWNVYYGHPMMENFTQLVKMKPITHNSEPYQYVSFTHYPLNIIYLKEDTLTGKVWASKHPDSTQWLVFDLSLNAGDTFAHYDFLHSNNRFILVDSTKQMNGRKWIYFAEKDIDGNQLNFNHSSDERYIFIEGIGSIYMDLLGVTTNLSNTALYLICAIKDGVEQIDYQNLAFNGMCDTSITSTNNINKFNIKLFPNPVYDVLLLENLPSKTHDIVLYDLMGKEIYRNKNKQPNFSMQLHDLAAGTYIITIITTEKITQSYKIVKY